MSRTIKAIFNDSESVTAAMQRLRAAVQL